MKHILVPTDFSENSWNAIQYGLSLFARSRCVFYLYHVNPIPVYSGSQTTNLVSGELLEEKLLKESEVRLHQLIERIESLPLNSKHVFVTLAAYDFFVDSIRKQIIEKKIDLIIMGTKGSSGIKKFALGSNTGDVITKVKCPLLAVPENAVYQKPKEIAFPTDYHIGFDLRVLDTLIEMAILNNAAIRIMHVLKKGDELTTAQIKNKDFLHDYLKDIPHSFHVLTGTKLEDAVQCFTESRDIAMIAMVAKNLNYFQRILFRPTVEELSYETDVPFLVLHE